MASIRMSTPFSGSRRPTKRTYWPSSRPRRGARLAAAGWGGRGRCQRRKARCVSCAGQRHRGRPDGRTRLGWRRSAGRQRRTTSRSPWMRRAGSISALLRATRVLEHAQGVEHLHQRHTPHGGAGAPPPSPTASSGRAQCRSVPVLGAPEVVQVGHGTGEGKSNSSFLGIQRGSPASRWMTRASGPIGYLYLSWAEGLAAGEDIDLHCPAAPAPCSARARTRSSRRRLSRPGAPAGSRAR